MTRRPSALAVGLAGPALLTLLGGVVAAVLARGATDPVAIHWGAAGEPDGFASPWLVVLTVTAVAAAMTLLFGTLLIGTLREPWAPSPTHKFLVVVVTAATALVVALGVWTLASQQGIASSDASAPTVGPGLAVGAGAALVAGLIAAVLTPRAVSRRSDSTPVEALELSADERAVWVGTAAVPAGAIAGIALSGLLVLTVTVVAIVQTRGAAWPVLLVPAFFVVLFLSLTRFTVRVDGAGLTVRGALGLPIWRIRADQVATVSVTRVQAIVDFGGWGVRIGSGRRTGIVTRSGEALEVRRRSGRALVVTVDDAAAGAALLQAIAERATV